jgi:hypothetical protein
MDSAQEKRCERQNFLRTIFAGLARIVNRAPHRPPLHFEAKARREFAAKKSNQSLMLTRGMAVSLRWDALLAPRSIALRSPYSQRDDSFAIWCRFVQ